VRLSDVEALSFDCYGTLIDREAGIADVLRPWARSGGLALDDEALLTANAKHEARVEADQPRSLHPEVLALSARLLGEELGIGVTAADAERLARSVPDWPAFPDSRDALTALSKDLHADRPVQRGPRVLRGQQPAAGGHLRQPPHGRGHRFLQAFTAQLRCPSRRGNPARNR